MPSTCSSLFRCAWAIGRADTPGRRLRSRSSASAGRSHSFEMSSTSSSASRRPRLRTCACACHGAYTPGVLSDHLSYRLGLHRFAAYRAASLLLPLRHVLCRKSLEKGWELLCIAITFFPPSNRFYSYLEGEQVPVITFCAR